MPLNYGSNFPLLPLAVGSTAVYKELKVEEDNSFWALLATIGLSLLEAAISFIPGVGGVAAVALGVGFAAARAEVNSAITGKEFDWKSFGIDAATPFISEVGGAFVGALGRGFKGRETIETLRSITGTTRETGEAIEREATSLFEHASEGLRVTGAEQTEILGKAEFYQGVSGAHTTLAENIEKGLDKFTGKNLLMSKEKLTDLQKLLDQEINKSLEGVNKISIFDRATGEWTTVGKVAGGLLKKEVPAWMKQNLSHAFERIEHIVNASGKATEAGIDQLSRKLGISPHIVEILSTIARNAKSATTISELVERLIARAAKAGVELSEDSATAIIIFVNATDIGFLTLAKKLGISAAWSAKALKFEGKKFMEISHDVIKNVMQPGDFVGDVVQKSFAKLSKQLEKGVKKFFSKFKKLWKAAKETGKFFTRTGGILVNSDVILGFKIINTDGIYDLIQISFYSNATGAKDPKARNHGGKKPVYKWATKIEQAKLISGGMAYYLERFANSRGGRNTSSTVNDFFNALPIVSQLAASLLPVRELTRIVSMVSMIERGVKNYQKNGGSKIWEDFTKDVTGKTISGGARLVSKGIGTALGGGFLGSLVGKMLANYVRPILRDGKPENIGEFLKKEVKQVTRHSVNHATKHSAVMKGMRRGTTGMRLSKRIRGLGKV